MSTNANAPAPDAEGVEIPAEHLVNPQLRRRLQQCYEYGRRQLAQEKKDHDYANTMFTECVVKDPSNLVYVEAFLDNLQDKFKNNKRGSRMLLGSGSKGEFKKAAAKKNWIDVLRLGPDVLKSNPWDVATLRAMAHACEAYRYNEVELRYLKNALDANPKDIEVNRHCAKSLARMGQFDQAIACWHRIEELKPNDPEASKKVSELSIERTRSHAGFGGATPPRRGAASAGSTSSSAAQQAASPTSEAAGEQRRAPAEAPAKREIQLTPTQIRERGIVDEPTIVENYLELIDIYVAEHRFSEADRVLQRGLSALPNNDEIRTKGEDLAILKVKHQLKVAEKRAAAENTDEARDLVEQVRQSMWRLELEIADARSQRFPEDGVLKYRVGLNLKRLANYREAAQRLQEARSDERVYIPATLELGECLQHLKQYVKALHCYQRAAEKSVDQAPLADLHKLALYRAAVLATGMKELDSAQKHLEQLMALDPDYKDVRTRLDKLREIGHKG
jgi:tetratricopeptide (TPR) repeat protein